MQDLGAVLQNYIPGTGGGVGRDEGTGGTGGTGGEGGDGGDGGAGGEGGIFPAPPLFFPTI